MKRLAICLLSCLGLACWSASASEASPSAMGLSPLAGTLVVPGVQPLDGGQQAQDAAEARRASPEAFVARQVSETAYQHLTRGQAAKLAAEVFPKLIQEPAGGPPPVPAGAKIVSYPSDNAARVALPAGKHGVIEAFEPIALETSPQHHVPIDLHLRETAGGFQPVFPVVRLHIPKRLSGGAGIPRLGVSLTPVDASGSPFAGAAGEVDGASVMYANAATDLDTVVKPTTVGFSEESLLRSVASPRQLFFRVGMPAGARLVWARDGSGALDVVADGAMIARVTRPSAQDAEGTAVPVSVGVVSGNVLSLTVAAVVGRYRLPISVDPEVEDTLWQNELHYGTYVRTEWHFEHGPYPEGGAFTAPAHPEGGSWTESISGSHNGSEFGGLFYTTRGASQITVARAEGHWNDTGSHVQNYMVLYAPKSPYTEDYDALPVATEEGRGFGGYACAPAKNCPETTVGPAPPENNNTAAYEQESTGSGGGTGGSNTVTNAYVDISQETGPELGVNTTSATIYNAQTGEYVSNVLYGGGGWLGPHSGAFEVRAKDPGLGLSLYRVQAGGWADRKYYYALGECIGIQCPEYNYQGYTYKTGMPDGELGLEGLAEDPAGLAAYIEPNSQKIKVDATPPQNIKVSGFRNGNELPLGETHLKIEARDGEGSTPSSGVKSIKVAVDGHEVSGSAASCPLGPCTASSEVTLAARNYSSGQHSLVVTATDNANNVAQEEFTFRVHGAAPVSVGPGTVDASTGQLTLGANDVSLGGTSGVSRTYQSRNLTAGAEGPLGPQWAINLGGGEGLTVLANGSAILTAAGGASTTFTRNAKGELESPTGDSNLKLEAKEKEPGKGVSEYVITDATAGTKTKFEQPAGSQSTAPTWASQFGAEAPTLKHPQGDTIDSSGNVWVTDYSSDLIEKFSPTGTLEATYGSQGTAGGQFNGPWGIAPDPRNGNIYITDIANSRVQELSPSGAFIKTFGWGVSDGKNEFEICTKECRAGIPGAGNGQLNVDAGIAVDAAGNIWVVDNGNSRIEEFNEKGEYLKTFGSLGSGNGQLKEPKYITISGGQLYVADGANNRVDEFSPEGTFLKAFGWGVTDGESKLETCTTTCHAGLAGTGNGQFNVPIGIATEPATGNLYVGDFHNTRVEEFTASGAFITKFGSPGSGPGQFNETKGVTISSSGGIYVADYTGRVEEWTRPSWVPTEAGGPLAASTTTYAYATVEEEGKPVIQPSEALAPLPTGVSSCTPLVKGCRALTFNYAETTTATGESPGEWGDYKGHLTRVYIHAWNPATKAMSETIVAQYAYDARGRLRAEWDPRISPALKTTYGYDAEAHVTAISPPGQQPWLLSYGTTEGDARPGRLLSATRPSAATALGNGNVPQATTEASLSTTKPVVGEAVTVNKGVWSNNPLSYAYQWYTCVSSGENETAKCSPIEGAVNPTYTPLTRDRGKKLRVVVSAMNGAGATEECAPGKGILKCSWAEMPEVGGTGELSQEPTPSPPAAGTNAVWTLEYHVPSAGSGAPYALGSKEVEAWGQKDDPVEGVAIFPPDEPMGWPAADYKRATISYWDTQGRMVNTALPSGGIATSEYNKTNDVVRTLSPGNRAAALKEGSKSVEVSKLLDTESHYNGETKEEQEHEQEEVVQKRRVAAEPGTELVVTLGPQHKVKLAEGGSEVLARSRVAYFYDEGSPEGKHYGLLTKTTNGAQYETKELNEADIRTTKTSYSGQNNLGWTLRKPTSVTVDPTGLKLTSTTVYEEGTGNVLERTTPAGNSKTPVYAYSSQFGKYGTASGQLSYPKQFALDAKGNVWVVDEENSRLSVFTEKGEFVKALGWGVTDGKAELESCTASCKAGIAGTGNGQFKGPKGIAIANGTVWVTDTGNNRLEELTESGSFTKAVGSAGSGDLQFNSPRGITIDPHGNLWIADDLNSRVEALTEKGEFIKVLGWGVTDGKAELETCTAPSCKAGIAGAGNGQFKEPKAQVLDTHGNLWVSDGGNNRLEKLNEKGEYVKTVGSLGSGAGQLNSSKDIKIDAHGNVWVVDEANHRVEQFTETGEFLETFGWGVTDGKAEFETCTKEAPSCKAGISGSGNGQFTTPWGITVDTHGNILISDESNHRLQSFKQANAAAHTSQTVYYSAGPNYANPSCGEHPEWASLPCQTQPAAQPEDEPKLPVSTFAYNIWDEVLTTTEKFGSTTRIKAETYDTAGRAVTSEATSTIDTALPKVTNEYNTETGALEKQSTTNEGNTKTITSVLNTLGELTSYTDADGNTTKYAYDIDRRVEEVNDGKGTQQYAYDSTTGSLTKLLDSAAGTFTASYDVEGNITSEGYPNGMTATYTNSSSGQATGLEYVKTTHCSEKCTWFDDSIVPSIHGETLLRTSTLAAERYSYDKASRLVETQETPAGKGCVTRVYSYDEESNRRSLTTREPGGEGKCASEGGSTATHSYDTANRLIDSGVTYEQFANITKLPAADAGKYEITNKYYIDNQLESQTQNSVTTNYHYDPGGRTDETVSAGKTVVSHYGGSGEAVTWTSEGSAWTRNISGIDGTLSAIQTGAGSTTLQLHDLQGNIVATAGLTETETKLLSMYNSTEFGVPQPGTTPPKYAWLGASGVATAALSPGVANAGGASYVPLVGKSLQTQPIATPGAFPNGTAAVGVVQAAYLNAAASQLKAIAVQHEAELEGAARRQAEEEAARNQCPASECGPFPAEGGAEEAGGSEDGELYDPEGLASYKRTTQRAEELLKDSVNGLLIGLAVDLAVPGAAEGGASYAAGLAASAYNLKLCVETGKGVGGKRGSWGVCFINETRYGKGPISVPVSATAEFCEYRGTRQWGKKAHNVYYCVDSKTETWGPWF